MLSIDNPFMTSGWAGILIDCPIISVFEPGDPTQIFFIYKTD